MRSLRRPFQECEKAQQSQLIWVAFDDAQQPVAFLMAGVLDACLRVMEFDVHPAYGRQSIGKGLLKHTLIVAKARSYPAVVLTTFEHVP